MSLTEFQQRIRAAAASASPLRLRGGGTKDFYGNEPRGAILDTRAYAGIVSYEPTELVVTARCGTALGELEDALARERQCLAFEPPHFGEAATLGGALASGLAGPRRATSGALRDFILGVKLVDGLGRVLAFGGEVMKNVAGYDVSRLVAGSLGTLGLIAEASLKVLPLPEREESRRLELSEAGAIETMNRWAGQPVAISATAWSDGQLSVRLSGSDAAVRAAAAQIGGTPLDGGFWPGIREQTDTFFSGAQPLWRLSLPSTCPPLHLGGRTLIEWGGAQRWVKAELDAREIRDIARKAGGHATLFRGGDKSRGCFSPLEPVLLRLHRGLKAAFDPAGILNPGRLYPEF